MIDQNKSVGNQCYHYVGRWFRIELRSTLLGQY